MTQQTSMPDLETKNASSVDDSFDAFMRSFDEYKSTNEYRLAEIERRGGTDVLTNEKLDRINDALDEQKRVIDHMLLKRARPHLEGGFDPLVSLEHKTAFDNYVRRGDESGLRPIEAKALSIGSATDGGYLVPPEMEREIGTCLLYTSDAADE